MPLAVLSRITSVPGALRDRLHYTCEVFLGITARTRTLGAMEQLDGVGAPN